MEAAYYTKLESGKVKCNLCPHTCLLNEGVTGICRIRKNVGGILQSESAHRYSAVNIDPIEKKPLYHFYPGRQVLSLGNFGCNMRCEWCQNCSISQKGVGARQVIMPDEILLMANQDDNNIGVAYTYNEPLINFESNLLLAHEVHKAGMKNVLVSNGYINQEPLKRILECTDAVNLDIKSFNAELHKKYTQADLTNVLRSAKQIYESGIHLELTMLIVPGISDDIKEFEQFVKWVSKELSVETPVHISRYFPGYKYKAKATPTELLDKCAEIANNSLRYVYTGNVLSSNYKNTYCPVCTNEIISRNGYQTIIVGADSRGCCTECGKKVFENS